MVAQRGYDLYWWMGQTFLAEGRREDAVRAFRDDKASPRLQLGVRRVVAEFTYFARSFSAIKVFALYRAGASASR